LDGLGGDRTPALPSGARESQKVFEKIVGLPDLLALQTMPRTFSQCPGWRRWLA